MSKKRTYQPHQSHHEYPRWVAWRSPTASIAVGEFGGHVVRFLFHPVSWHDTAEAAQVEIDRLESITAAEPRVSDLYAEARRLNAGLSGGRAHG